MVAGGQALALLGLVTLHEDEVPADRKTARALIREQCPDWADLPLREAGSGTDNTMYRLGEDLLVRLPRTANTAEAVEKERTWLPRLAPELPLAVPEPLHRGDPTEFYPLPWSVYRWIDGTEVGEDSIDDWSAFAKELAGFVRALHAVDLQGARRADSLSWYRGGSLADTKDWINGCFDKVERRGGVDLDLSRLRQLWLDGLALPDSPANQVWLHGDLKPSNLLAREGRLHAVIDFGTLSVGLPDAEHAAIWDLPKSAREAYWNAVEIDESTWLRARAWAILVAISGVSYYWTSNRSFVEECLNRLRAILDQA